MKKQTILAIATFATLSGGVALAQTNDEGVGSIQRSSVLADVPAAPTGLGVQLGGGVTGFSRQGARDEFGTGGYWDARAIIGTRSYVGAELAYVGSARDIKAGGVSDNAALLGNGAEAVVRGNLPLRLRSALLTPYVFGGAGWSYYQIVNNDGPNMSGIKDHSNAFVVPFGAGASFSYDHFLADARFTYRAEVNKLVPTGNGDHLDLQNWSAGGTLGYEF
jgi:hypothetical protein